MYYLTNERNQIIAADDKLLTTLNIENIEDLSKKIALEEISFVVSPNGNMNIDVLNETFVYTTSASVLSSFLGDIHLITLTLIEEELTHTNNIDELAVAIEHETPSDELISSIEEVDDELLDLTIPKVPDEAIDEINLEEELDEPKVSSEETEVSFLLDDSISIDTITFPTNDELLDTQILDTDEDTLPIIIYVDEVSQNIGISTDDYSNFFNEYMDTAISLKEDLRSEDKQKYTSATTTLAHLADVLELPKINGIISELHLSSFPEKEKHIASLYSVLTRLTVKNKNITTQNIDTNKNVPLFTTEILSDENTQIKVSNEEKSFGTVSLEEVKPIYFNFKLEEAANDLSLPVELIEEFVHDFIEQAHIETEKMLSAYKKGDLDTIQKIGHMLKGASSNLRIAGLSDALYQIQFCEDSNNLEGFIKQYWGKFLSFEQQINVLSNKGNE